MTTERPDPGVGQPGGGSGDEGAPTLLGSSPAMRQVRHQVRRMAATGAGVLITGETGSGKEVVAQTLHRMSLRRDRPFVALNCGAVSPSLFESEMFGHERGSFTGASRMHRGAFERADHGTLFLDEIADLPIELQANLLRVLEGGEFARLGGHTRIRVDVRVLAATNRDPLEAIREGRLREDLYYRLNVLRIRLPTLRNRPGDILPLARHFLAEVPGGPRSFPPKVEALLLAYPWLGNVRELRNEVRSAAHMSRGSQIDSEELSDEVRLGRPIGGPMTATPSLGDPDFLRLPSGTTLGEAERRLILATLEGLHGHKTRAANTLGISVKTLYNRLDSYGWEQMSTRG